MLLPVVTEAPQVVAGLQTLAVLLPLLVGHVVGVARG